MKKKYLNTNLVSNEKKTPQHQGKNQTYPSPTEYAKKKERNSVSNEKKPYIKGKTKEQNLPAVCTIPSRSV